MPYLRRLPRRRPLGVADAFRGRSALLLRRGHAVVAEDLHVGDGSGVSKPKLWNCSACAAEGHQEPTLVWHYARHRLAAVRVAGVARVASGGVDVKSRAVRSRRG